jgi:hypothetical protein
MTFVGVGYGAALAYTGQMPEEKYFKGKNLIPAPKIIPIPLPEKTDLDKIAVQEILDSGGNKKGTEPKSMQ